MKSYISLLILSCLQKINGERTIYSIFHLLKGKKSSQTIQDAHLFQLTNLFYTFPQISRPYFDEMIIELKKKEYIDHLEVERYVTTKAGISFLEEKLKQMPIPNRLNGWKFHSIQVDFWKRLSLLVQVCSNLIHYEASYIPIQNEVHVSNWVKTTLRQFSQSREVLAEQLRLEIIRCLSAVADIKPEVLVLRLTGYKRIGLTQDQAAEELKMDPFQFQLEFLNIIHYLIEEILIRSSEVPILQNLLFDFQKPIVLTKSSAMTYKYLLSGNSIEEIAIIRNLKQSTIEDHVVEIAINEKSFPIEPFVSIINQNQIKQSIEKLSSKQLKFIRQDIKEQVSYFQIRLVLAKLGDS